MRLFITIIFLLLLVGCTTSQDQGHDYKETKPEVHKQAGSQEPTIMSPYDERYRQSNQY